MAQNPDKEKKAKILAPTFHFTTKNILIGEDETSDKIPVSELVMAEQLLADFPNFQRFASKGFEKAATIPGDYATFSEDGESIIAAVPGYPKIIKTRQKGESGESDEVTVVSIEPLFITSINKMKVTLAYHPPLPDACSLQTVDLDALLEDQGIVFGISDEALADTKKYIEEGEIEFKKIALAEGQPVGLSSDACLHFELEIGPIAGTILDDGSIDFRDRKIMIGVEADQVIATKHPAVQGTPGINVFGEETPATEGKDLKVKLLNDASFSHETMQVTALKNGILSVVNDNVIKVSSRQIIYGDVDYTTGNIDSRNCVSIRGSVQPGFLVHADGDLEIAGAVMSTKITGLSNVVIKGGITGEKSIIDMAGDCDLKFIEQGNVVCGGICVIRKQSYYSNITSGSHIRCTDSSKIMSGNLIAKGSIATGDVGSENSAPALLAAGTVASRLEHFDELKQNVVEQQDEIVKWLQRYPGSSRSKKVRNMEKELAEAKLLLLKVNMIPGTGIYSRVGAKLINGKETEPLEPSEDYSDVDGIDMSTITISVHGTIFAGTKIRIGNCTLTLDKTISGRKFMLHPNQKRIIAKAIGR